MLATLAHLALAALIQAAGDDFDRVSGTDLGVEWSEAAGELQIQNQALLATSGFGLATRRDELVYAAANQSIRFQQTSSAVGYVALVSGHASLSESLFAKLQDDDADGEFETVYFYRGNNSGLAWNSSEFRQALALPRAMGRMSLHFEDQANVAVLTITDLNGGSAEEFRCSDVRAIASGLGRGVGCGVFGSAVADDWELNGGRSAELSLRQVRGGPGALTEVQVSGGTPFQSVVLLSSDALGASRLASHFPCSDGVLSITQPIQLTLLTSDALGESSLLRFLPAAAEGRLAVQALDVLSCRLSFPLAF